MKIRSESHNFCAEYGSIYIYKYIIKLRVRARRYEGKKNFFFAKTFNEIKFK